MRHFRATQVSASPPSRARRWTERILEAIPEPQPVRWSVLTSAGLVSLACFWAVLFACTWAKWGDISIDCGREMYVPWELSLGKTLYRDVWYPYGPLGPYLNSMLYRIWGASMPVLYWAGSFSALGCAVLLYMTGMRLSSVLAGWTAAAVVIGEAFCPDLFSFPLSYSFDADYGALASCVCLWCCVCAASSPGWLWVFSAATAAAAALLCKIEFGSGCYIAVGVLILGRGLQTRSLRQLVKDVFATLPSVAACASVIAWMISLGGWDFFIQENQMSLPSTYFMKTYGAAWLGKSGLRWDHQSLLAVALCLLAVLWLVAFRMILRRYGPGWLVFSSGSLILLAGLAGWRLLKALLSLPPDLPVLIVRSIFFPNAMVFMILATAPLLVKLVWRSRCSGGFLSVLVLVVGAASVAFRTLFGTKSLGYSIYYNGPVILSFLLLSTWVAFPKTAGVSRPTMPAGVLPFAALFIVAFFPAAHAILSQARVEPLVTQRGLIYLPLGMAAQYQAAIRIMKDAALRGESTLSVPEDTSLYFLSGARSPTRVFSFTPGIVSPGKMMDQLIAEIEHKQVRYLIWSNRKFAEYGVPEFGVDFDRPLGDYFRSHFRPIASFPGDTSWRATLWERTAQRTQVHSPL